MNLDNPVQFPSRNSRGQYGSFVCHPVAMNTMTTPQHMVLVCSDSPSPYRGPHTKTAYVYINGRPGSSDGSRLVYWIDRDFKTVKGDTSLGWHDSDSFLDYLHTAGGLVDPHRFLITGQGEQGDADITDYLSGIFSNAIETQARFYIVGDRFEVDRKPPPQNVLGAADPFQPTPPNYSGGGVFEPGSAVTHDAVFGGRPADFVMYNIHMNQGNGRDIDHQDNSQGRDGAILMQFPDSHWEAVFIAFASQSYQTDHYGAPTSGPFSSIQHLVPSRLTLNPYNIHRSWALNKRQFKTCPRVVITAVTTSGEAWLQNLTNDRINLKFWSLHYFNPAAHKEHHLYTLHCDLELPGWGKIKILPTAVPASQLPAVGRDVEVLLYDDNKDEEDFVTCERARAKREGRLLTFA